jgi:3D (Asp-Asp-Asp) domain-containing protein
VRAVSAYALLCLCAALVRAGEPPEEALPPKAAAVAPTHEERVAQPLLDEAGVPERKLPKSIGGPHDRSKVEAKNEGLALKLPRMAKIKECCGYPIAQKDGFRLSFYWVAYESEYSSLPYDVDIYTKQGFFIGRFPSAFVFELKLEGSGILNDGRILNYDGECNYGMGTCFKTLDLSEHPLGAGVQGRKLVPFRSIAVDPRYIPIGATVYVPELAGVQLPDGTRHDGCLRADDMGGAIKQHKIDFFVESYNNFKLIADNLWWHLKATPHLDEPRCEYLLAHDVKERTNEHTDWVLLHMRELQSRLAQKARTSMAKVKRSRALAQAWINRHYGLTQKPKNKNAVAHHP